MRSRTEIVADIRRQATLLSTQPDGEVFDQTIERLDVLRFELRALENPPFDPFNCPACGRHDFGLIRADRLNGAKGYLRTTEDPFHAHTCDRKECPLPPIPDER